MEKTVKVVVVWKSIYYGDRQDLIEIPERWLGDKNLITLVAMRLNGVEKITSVTPTRKDEPTWN